MFLPSYLILICVLSQNTKYESSNQSHLIPYRDNTMPNIVDDVKLDFKDVLLRPKRSKIRSRADVSNFITIFLDIFFACIVICTVWRKKLQKKIKDAKKVENTLHCNKHVMKYLLLLHMLSCKRNRFLIIYICVITILLPARQYMHREPKFGIQTRKLQMTITNLLAKMMSDFLGSFQTPEQFQNQFSYDYISR